MKGVGNGDDTLDNASSIRDGDVAISCPIGLYIGGIRCDTKV